MKKIENKKTIYIAAIALVSGLFLGWLFFHNNHATTELATHEHVDEQGTIWTCSMHPQIRMDEPGKCPICSMDLIPLESEEAENIDPNEIVMSESAIKLADIQTLVVKRGIPEADVFLLGKVKPDERRIAELTARFGGRIEKLFVNFTGQNVVKGQKLATIYSPELVSAQKELIEAIKFKNSNPGLYTAAKSKLKLWDLTDAQISRIENEGEPILYFDVLAPISGTVTQRQVALGDYVKEGSALFEVTDLTHVWVMFEAYESDLPWINIGDQINFTIQSLPGKNLGGKITYIDPFINPQTRIAQVRVELSNKSLELKPEMFANGRLQAHKSSQIAQILIPKSSVLWTGKRSVVYVKVPGRNKTSFVFREIDLGAVSGNFYVVENGLMEGEEIAINGVFKIDAAAQLAGKPSMMNPEGGKVSMGHNHGGMKMGENAEMDNGNKSEIHGVVEHTSFKVAGNCEMCKKTIETAATSLDGVNNATWDIDSKIIHVSFNSAKVSLLEIHKAIAAAGYDTEKETAPAEAYEKLPHCCKYTR